MKKQTRHMLIMIAVLIAALAVYFGLRAWNSANKASADEEYQSRMTEGLLDLARLVYTDSEDNELVFVKNENGWTSQNEPELQLSQDMILAMETAFTTLRYQRVLEEPEALSAYGLEHAARTITGTNSKGISYTVYLGNQIPYQNIYYAAMKESSAVYLVSSDLFTVTDYDLLELAVVEKIPEWTESNIKSIQLTQGGETVQLNKLTEKKQQIQQQDSGKVDENGNPIMKDVSVAVEVYRWSSGGGWRVSGKNETLLAVLEELSALEFSGVADYRPSEDKLKEYALETSVTVECVDGIQTTLWIGAADHSGTYYYACLNDFQLIHCLPIKQIESLFAMTEKALRA